MRGFREMEGGGFLGLEIERGQRHKVQFGQSGIVVDFFVSAPQQKYTYIYFTFYVYYIFFVYYILYVHCILYRVHIIWNLYYIPVYIGIKRYNSWSRT